MEFGALLARIWADPLTNNAIIVVVAVALLDLLTGIARAVANSTFQFDLVDVWVRATVAGRVIPIVLVLVFGAVIGNISLGSFSFNILTAAALAAAVVYVAATAQSIIDNLSASKPDSLPVE